MGYWDVEKNCDEYVSMIDGYDGQELIDAFSKYVKPGARILELGMGPGADLDVLRQHYDAVGSDASAIWVERYEAERKGAIDVRVLDAITIEVDEQFDAVYSNKVLHHLYEDEMVKSLERQAEILKPGGIAFHSYWYGSGQDEAMGMLFSYYDEEALEDLIPDAFEVVDLWRFGEMEEDDSIALVLRKKS